MDRTMRTHAPNAFCRSPAERDGGEPKWRGGFQTQIDELNGTNRNTAVYQYRGLGLYGQGDSFKV
jgi:hypothetical protein